MDWDRELIKYIGKVSEVNTREELSNVYLEWINSLGGIRRCKACANVDTSYWQTDNLNIAWRDNKTIFTDSLVSLLHYIGDNKNFRRNYYVKQLRIGHQIWFSHENEYKDSVFPQNPCRLLSLFRYWNMINYFYPYKYVIGEDWNAVLDRLVLKFRYANITEYHLAMMELTASIHDSHAKFYSLYAEGIYGYYWAPFKFIIMDDKAVVTGFFNTDLCTRNDIRIGDVIESVNGKRIADIISEKSKYIGASNKPTILRDMYAAIFNGNTNLVNIKYERDGKDTSKWIQRCYNKEFDVKVKDTNKAWKIMGDNIGYINMGILKQKDIKIAMHELKNTKGIIFDIRNYPILDVYEVSKYLNKESRNFVRFTTPVIEHPGVYKFRDWYWCGVKNKDYYKGHVALLINEETQSGAEFTCMMFQTAPDVKCIGSQTAGADGNVIDITFPGNLHTFISGIGVFYPDGRETQRIGIVPDIEVHPTIAGIRAHKDELLDRAVEYIKSRK